MGPETGAGTPQPSSGNTVRNTLFPRTLRQALDHLGWRPEHLAERLNTLASLQGRPERLHAKTPYKWLNGSRPRKPWPTLLTALLDDHLPVPLTPVDLGLETDEEELLPASSGLQLPWNAAGGLRAARTLADGEENRFLFLTLVGPALTSPAHEWLIARTVPAPEHRTGCDLPGEVIDQLDLITAGLRRMDDHLGGGTLHPLLAAHLRGAVDLLEERRYGSVLGRRLFATIAEILRLGGFLAFDAGLHARAQRFWTAALHVAHAASDRAVGANVLGFMSCQAKDLGRVREAVVLAESARSGHPTASGRVRAILDLRAAEAHAADGDPIACRHAVDSAFERLGDPPSPTDPDWAYWMDLPQAHGQAGSCFLRLGHWNTARRHLRASLREQGNVPRETALRQLLLSTVCVRKPRPDLDQALDLGNRALNTLTGQVTSARATALAAALARHLAPYCRTSAVHTFV
ncbi:MAG: hypothetical protein QG608_726, partial [Actinomycetota bacterium]|nr:hypothetical protein [Actinomycetota bacterium]